MVLGLSRWQRAADLAKVAAANQHSSTGSDSAEDQQHHQYPTYNPKWQHQNPYRHVQWFKMQSGQRMRHSKSMGSSICPNAVLVKVGRQRGEQRPEPEQKADKVKQNQAHQTQQGIRRNHLDSRKNKNSSNNKNQLCQNDVAAPSEGDNRTSSGRRHIGCDKATLRSPRRRSKLAEATQHVHATKMTAAPWASGGDEMKPPTAISHQRTSMPPRLLWAIIFIATVCCWVLQAPSTSMQEQTTQRPALAVAASMATILASSSLSALVALTQISPTQRRQSSLTVATAAAIGGCHIGYPWPRLVALADAAAVVTTYEPSLHTEFKFQIVDEDDGLGGVGAEEDEMDEEPAETGPVASTELDGEIVVVEEDVGGEEGDYGQDNAQRVFYDERAEDRGAADEERRLRYRLQEIPLPPLNVYEVNVDFDEIEPTAGVVSTLKPHSDVVADDESLQKKKSVTKRSSSSSADPAGGVSSRLGGNDRKDGASTTPLPSSTMMSPAVKATANPTTITTTSSTQTSGGNNNSATEECEPKVLSQIPEEPYYDYTELIGTAAHQFTEYLAAQFPAGAATNLTEQMRDDVRRKANAISTVALNEDSNLLAFAIAAPSIHTVVVKFRDNVTIPLEQVHNKGYLGSYWRELGYAWNSTENSQEWGAPFRDCNLLKGRWLWPFRLSFTDANIKIVAAAFIAADEDVCNDELEEVFGRRHGCDRNTTFCLLTGEGKPLSRDAYTCICRETFYLPNSTLQGFAGELVEGSEGYNNYSCLPCPGGCTHCDQHGVCLLGEPQEAVSLENLLKVTVGSVLGACILCCVVLSVIVFRQRKSKAIASGMWTVLETILLGIVLLYASVAVHFFPASTERCLIEPWLRELGFITCYGAIILKLYRHLVDFRTRKAHRWVLRDVDLLKYLATMIFAVICYMCAFTASSLDLMETGQLESLRELRTNTCLPMKWEYVTQASELLILCFGLHLSFASRNANTQFRERQFLVVTLVLEFVVSATFYMMRCLYLPEMSPGATFLALFVRSLLTNTIALGLIFVPKLWYQHKQGSHDAGQRLGGGYAGLCLGDPDIGELTISEMSPEDIRAELKRLYTQLEILKNKTLRQDNPHISKRRGGRKAGHRRFSLQKKGSKDKALSAKHRSNKHHQDIEITEAEPSRTPEDSVCSAEGPTDTYAEISGVSHSMISHSVVSHSVASHSK